MSQDNTLLKLAIVVGVLLVVLPLTMWMVMPHSQAGAWSHMGDGMWGGLGGWILMMLMPLVVILLIGYFIYATGVTESKTTDDDDALETLRMAYARGDIDDEEFDRRKTKLEQTDDR